MRSELRTCGCRDVFDDGGKCVVVSTCTECLPPGAITQMIENGRQLELGELAEGMAPMGAGDGYEKYAQDPSEILQEVRILDPHF